MASQLPSSEAIEATRRIEVSAGIDVGRIGALREVRGAGGASRPAALDSGRRARRPRASVRRVTAG